jgi:hypothetical protein
MKRVIMGWKTSIAAAIAAILTLSFPAAAAVVEPDASGPDSQATTPPVGDARSDHPEPAVAPLVFTIIVPTVEVTESNIDAETLKAILNGDIGAHADELAGLTAKSIVIPEFTVRSAGPDGKGGTAVASFVYKDFRLEDVRNGVAAELSTAGMTSADAGGGALTYGKTTASNLDIGAVLAIYGYGAAAKGEQRESRLISSHSDIESVSFAGPAAHCTLGKTEIGAVRVRPGTFPLEKILAMAQDLNGQGRTPDPKDVSTFFLTYFKFLHGLSSEPASIAGLKCSGKGENDRPFEVAIGPISIGAFGGTAFPPVTIHDIKVSVAQGKFGLANFVLKKIDFSVAMTAIEAAGDAVDETWFKANGRKLIPAFEGLAFSGLDIDAPPPAGSTDPIRAAIGDFDLTLSDYVNGIPTEVASSLHHFAAALPKKGDANIEQLRALGIEKVDVGYELSGAWDEAAQTIGIDKLLLTGVDLGTVSASGLLGNATSDLFTDDASKAEAAAAAMTLRGLNIDVQNDGLADRLFTLTAAQQGKDVTAYKTSISGMAQGTILAVFGGTEGAKKLADAVGAFIAGAKQLSIEVKAKDEDGIGLPDLMMIQEDPTAISDKIDVNGSAN